MSGDEARRLPVTIDVSTLQNFGSSTWMTDAGPVDVLAELRDRNGGRHGDDDLIERSVRYRVGPVVVSLAALEDIISSKEFAGSSPRSRGDEPDETPNRPEDPHG